MPRVNEAFFRMNLSSTWKGSIESGFHIRPVWMAETHDIADLRLLRWCGSFQTSIAHWTDPINIEEFRKVFSIKVAWTTFSPSPAPTAHEPSISIGAHHLAYLSQSQLRAVSLSLTCQYVQLEKAQVPTVCLKVNGSRATSRRA